MNRLTGALVLVCACLGAGGVPTAASAAAAAGKPLARYALSPGWATFGLVLPQGSAAAVKAGDMPTQTDVKVRWPDGSIRFAVVTVRAASRGDVQIVSADSAPGGMPASGDGPAGTIAPLSPVVRFVIAGQQWTAAAPSDLHDLWLSGPLVREGRAVVAPASPSGAAHPTLRVIFDIRAYTGGGYRVDVAVENGCDVATADRVTYDVEISLAGRRVFARGGVSHGYLARWRQVFRDGLQEASVTPDFAPFTEAGALPDYQRSIENPAYATDGPRFEILQFGALHLPMSDVGGRPEIAPYPDWAAQYIVHRRPEQRAFVLAHGDLAGSFGIHMRKPDGIGLISIDERPNYWLDPRADADSRPANGLRGQAEMADIAHQPSLAYLPYLVTGDRYYADELRFWANFCLIGTYQDAYYNAREGSRGLLIRNQVRGIGWALRNLGDAVYLPDSDPFKPYLLTKLKNNLAWLEEQAQTSHTPLGTMFTGHRPEDQSAPPYTWIALWEHAYVAWALDHLQRQGLSAGTACRDRIARFQLSLFQADKQGYPRAYAAPYVLAVGTRSGETFTYFTTLADVFRYSFGDRREPPARFAGYWGVEARTLLIMAADAGLTGVREAYDFLMSATSEDGTSMVSDVNRRSGWALAPGAALAGGRTSPAGGRVR